MARPPKVAWRQPALAWVWLAVMALWLAPAATARADQELGGQSAELFRQGREAMKRNDYAEACSRFGASQRLAPAPGTLLNLAVCFEKLGRLRRARQALEEFLERTDAKDDRRPRTLTLLANIEERTPRLQLRIANPVPIGTRVFVDGEEISRDSWQVPVVLDPGQHVLEVRAPRLPDERRTFEIKERESVTEAFVFAATKQPGSEPLLPTRASRVLPASFYVSLGIGVAGLVTAAGSALFVLNDRSVVDEHCQNMRCDAEGLAAAEHGERFATVNTIALPVGVVGMTLATYVLLTTKKERTSRPISLAIGSSHAVVFAERKF